MKKRRMIVKYLVEVFVLSMAGIVTAATRVTEPQAKGARHTLSEIVDSTTEWEKMAAVSSGFIEGLCFDRSGKLWMVDVTAGRIMKVENDQVIDVGQPYGMPNGAKFHKDGRLFVADARGELYTFNTSTGVRTPILHTYGSEILRGLNDLIFDNDGGLYVTEPTGSNALNTTGRVFYLPPGGTELQLFKENLAFPNGIAISADGKRVYIADFAKNQVIAVPAINATGKDLPFVFCRYEGGVGPDGLAVDSEGNLYAARLQAGEVSVVDSNGFSYGAIRLPVSAGTFSSNIVINDGYLYVAESSKNEVWRIKIKKTEPVPYGLQ